MKKLIALLLAVLLIACISVPAFATNGSNPGGVPQTDPKSPTTGSVAIVALAVVACGAGAAYAVTKRKSK